MPGVGKGTLQPRYRTSQNNLKENMNDQMSLREAVQQRRSIRKFRPDPVPREILHAILEEARWAPSAINTQPWEVALVGGEALKKIVRATYEEVRKGGIPRPDFDIPYFRKAVYTRRMRENAKGLFGDALRIDRYDLEKRGAFYLTMLHYFDAPQVIYLCVDKSLSWISIFDCGCFAQNLCLLAVSKGLGTCIQQSGVHFPDIIRKYVPIPEEKRILLNISIGYPDDEAPVNQFRSRRDPLEDFIIGEVD